MSTVLEHDARACMLGICSGDARAYATHERTHERTYAEGLTTSENSIFVTRAGGLNRCSSKWTQNAAQHPTEPDSGHGPTPAVDLALLRAAWIGWLFPTTNAHSYPGRPLTRELIASCTNAATRRTDTAFVAASRHSHQSASCHPLARWQGKSDGSNPLRPLAQLPAASRSAQSGCVYHHFRTEIRIDTNSKDGASRWIPLSDLILRVEEMGQ